MASRNYVARTFGSVEKKLVGSVDGLLRMERRKREGNHKVTHRHERRGEENRMIAAATVVALAMRPVTTTPTGNNFQPTSAAVSNFQCGGSPADYRLAFA